MSIYKIKSIVAFLGIFCCLVSTQSIAQTIQGNSTVSENEIHVYTYTDEVLGSYEWIINGGIAQTAATGTGSGNATYSITIEWTTAGAGSIAFGIGHNSTVIASKNITIQQGAYPPPGTPINVTGWDRCGAGTVNLSATPTGAHANQIWWYDCLSHCTPISTSSNYSPNLAVGTHTFYAFSYSTVSELRSLNHATITINVRAFIDSPPGVISSTTNIVCYNTSPGQLTGTPATGGTSIDYQWQKKTTGSFVDIPGATGLNYPTPGNLTEETQYWRRAIDSHCGSKVSNIITIAVRNPLTSGSISPDKTICYNTSVGTIQNISSPTGGDNNNRIYAWKKRPVGGTWGPNIPGATLAYYTPSGTLQTDTEYQRIVTSCGETETTETTVYVDALSVGGTINGSTSAYGNQSGSLTLQGKTGSVVKWEYKEFDDTNWTNISNTTTSQSYTNVDKTTYYRVTVKNGVCAPDNSSQATITIYEVPNIIIDGPENLMYGSQTTLITDDVHDQYQWKKEEVDITGATTNSYQVKSPGNYTLWVRKTASGPTYTTGTTVIGDGFETQSADLNFVSTIDLLKPGIDSNTNMFTLTDGEVALTTQYMDGLGRGIQTVNAHASVNKNDIIQPVVYDGAGRQIKSYLPYTTQNAGQYNNDPVGIAQTYVGSPHQLFYQTTAGITSDANPFSETVYEVSPLNRVSQQYGPGEKWSAAVDDRPINYHYEVNVINEVRFWEITGGFPISTVDYAAGELYKNVTVDEQSHQVIEFVDKLGRTILKRVQAVDNLSATYVATDWADTYYVYDDFGNLRYVMPPEAVKNLDQYNNQ